jgi:hypothetical protein
VSEFSRALGRYRHALKRAFGAEPAFEHQSD